MSRVHCRGLWHPNGSPASCGLPHLMTAEFLGLAASTLAAWRSHGREDSPPLFKFGRAVRYSEKDLLAWRERQRA